MKALIDLLESKNIRSALIVDDAFDAVPLATDMSVLDRDEWSQFFSDLTVEDRERLALEYPVFNSKSGDDLMEDSAFVACLWRIRDELSPGTAKMLFDRYSADNGGAVQQLDLLIKLLESYSLTASTCGRSFEIAAETADLILIDLYLGSGQEDSDMRASIDGLARVTKKRTDRPPLVVLMSSSTRLVSNYAAFRDATGLFASGFRFITKAGLSEPKALERIIHRLAIHKDDSWKLASFVEAWQAALARASSRTTSLLRTLDLPEFRQIYDLLLSDEESSIGSFFVDVVDRVLQHEVEAEALIIESAQRLNTIDFTSFPSRFVGESPDLQTFVFRSTFQHPTRLKLSGNGPMGVAFGDLLLPKVINTQDINVGSQRLELKPGSVFVVLTPACSLQRGEAKRVLLLSGTIQSLTMKDWYAKGGPVRTPVVELDDSSKNWIKWDLEHIETLSKSEIEDLLGSPTGIHIAGRLRDLYAVELQQKLLAHLGRVGVSAPMPGAFAVNVKIAFVNTGETLDLYTDDGADALEAAAFVGRKSDATQTRLSLPESTCNTICNALRGISKDQRLHSSTLARINEILETREYDLLATLEEGVTLKEGMLTSFMPVSFLNPQASGNGGRSDVAFYVTRLRWEEFRGIVKKLYQYSPIVLFVSESGIQSPAQEVSVEEITCEGGRVSEENKDAVLPSPSSTVAETSASG